jgi:multiple sugar transport system substrate-binding protein
MQKIQSSLAAGTDMPDILRGEVAFRGNLYDLDISEDLSAPPYNFDKNLYIPQILTQMQGADGKLYGLDEQFAAAGLGYRRDLMKQYFGIEEPEDVEKLIPDWDAFIKAGLELKAKSNGTVNMFASIQDLLYILQEAFANMYINGTNVNLTSRYGPVFDLAVRIRDSGCPLGNYENETPAWRASWSKGDTMFYVVPTWGLKTYVFTNDQDGIGRWGLVKMPGNGFIRGGTSIGIYKGSKNKEIAWAYVNYVYGTKEGCTDAYNTLGWIFAHKAFWEAPDPTRNPGAYDKYFKGQNTGRYYYEKIAPSIVTEPPSVYANMMRAVFAQITSLMLRNNTMSAQQALQEMITAAKLRFPEGNIR